MFRKLREWRSTPELCIRALEHSSEHWYGILEYYCSDIDTYRYVNHPTDGKRCHQPVSAILGSSTNPTSRMSGLLLLSISIRCEITPTRRIVVRWSAVKWLNWGDYITSRTTNYISQGETSRRHSNIEFPSYHSWESRRVPARRVPRTQNACRLWNSWHLP